MTRRLAIAALILGTFLTGCNKYLATNQTGGGGSTKSELTEADLNNGNLANLAGGSNPRAANLNWGQGSGSNIALAPMPTGMSFHTAGFGGPISPFDPGLPFDNYSQPVQGDAFLMFSGHPEVDFGKVEVGQSVTKKILVGNFGNGAALLVNLSLDIAPDYFRYEGGDCSQILPVGAVCFMDLSYRPTAAEARKSAELRLIYLSQSGQIRAAYRTLKVEAVVTPSPTPTPTPEPQLLLGMGEQHTCAIVEGETKCWGYNGNGQLGNNSTTDSRIPTPSNLSEDADAVVGGWRHTCALVNGAAKCWGYNGHGELGDNSNTQRRNPVTVYGLDSNVTAISTFRTHTCAVQNGAAKCWGNNGHGQLGDNTNTNRKVPVAVYGLGSGVVQIATGDHHTCALTSAGAVKCWGYNGLGQLGDNSTQSKKIPITVYGLESGIRSIYAGGDVTCAIRNSGEALCWGRGSHGQLGNNDNDHERIPASVYGLGSGVTAMAVGENHACAIRNGALKCWGYNGHGQLGDNSTSQSFVPVSVVGMNSGVTEVKANFHQTCAVQSGRAYCWGYNGNGQLGNNSTTSSRVPFEVYPAYLY